MWHIILFVSLAKVIRRNMYGEALTYRRDAPTG